MTTVCAQSSLLAESRLELSRWFAFGLIVSCLAGLVVLIACLALSEAGARPGLFLISLGGLLGLSSLGFGVLLLRLRLEDLTSG